MWKSVIRTIFQGFAAVLTVIAMTNIGTNSMFMMYQPEPPKKKNVN